MTLPPLLHDAGAAATLALGALGLLQPAAVARFVRLAPRGLLGRSEIRATYGGLFAAMGAFALLAQDRVAFAVLGAGWLGAAAGRALSIWLDRSREPRNFAALLLEAVLAALLLAPS